MAKIRVHELSKQLNISNKDIIDTLGAKGIEDQESYVQSGRFDGWNN